MLKKIEISILLIAFFILMIAIAGCTSPQPAPEDDDEQDTERAGRVITPDSEWDTADPGDDDSDPDGDDDDDPDGDSGGLSHIAAECDIRILRDGMVIPLDVPMQIWEGFETEIVFHLTATGSELAVYDIRNAAHVSYPRLGELSGFEATIPYLFTYNKDAWDEWGIMITVRNVQGDVFSRNILIESEPLPVRN